MIPKLLYIGLQADGATLDFESEVQAIKSGISTTAHEVQIKTIINPTFIELKGLISSFEPTILHVAGHGSENEISIPSNSTSSAQTDSSNSSTDWSEFLNSLKCRPSILIFGTCRSSDFVKMLADQCDIDCTLGFPEELTDQQATIFFELFYEEAFKGALPLTTIVEKTNEQTGLETMIHWNPRISDEILRTYRIVDPVNRDYKEGFKFEGFRLFTRLQEDDLSTLWKAKTIAGDDERILRIFKFQIPLSQRVGLSEELNFIQNEFSSDHTVLQIDDFEISNDSPFISYLAQPEMQWITLESFFEKENYVQGYPLKEPHTVFLIHRLYQELATFYSKLHTHATRQKSTD